jgi:hypothetical protein
MRKLATSLSMAILIWSANAVLVFAGGQFFVGLGRGPQFFPGAVFAFQHRGSRVHFFFQLGHQPFVISPFAPGPWGYNYPPAMSQYPVSPQEIRQQSFSGTDPNGALYIDGYRVLPSGWLRVHIEPTDAEVLIDGFPVSVDSASGVSSSLGFPVGQHQVEARKAGFQEFHSEFEIIRARESRLKIRLVE